MSAHKIIIDKETCKQCHNCVKACTAVEKVLEIDNEGYPKVVRKEMCIQCLMCETVCSTKAIKHINYRET